MVPREKKCDLEMDASENYHPKQTFYIPPNFIAKGSKSVKKSSLCIFLNVQNIFPNLSCQISMLTVFIFSWNFLFQ